MSRRILLTSAILLLSVPPALRAVQQPGVTGGEPPPASADSGKEGKPKSLTKKAMPIVNRVWTDVSGNQTTAKFIRIVGDRVVLGWGTKTMIVPFGELSSGDQEYVKELLTSHGQAALIPGGSPPAADPTTEPPVDTKGNPAGGLEFSRGPAPRGPNDPAPPTAGAETTTAGEPSSLFEEMRKRDEEQRQERSQDVAEAGPAPAEQPTPAEPPVAAAQESAPAADSPLAAPFDAQTIADAKEMFIIGGIIMAVITTVGFIVWVAITIASRSSVSHQRRYF